MPIYIPIPNTYPIYPLTYYIYTCSHTHIYIYRGFIDGWQGGVFNIPKQSYQYRDIEIKTVTEYVM